MRVGGGDGEPSVRFGGRGRGASGRAVTREGSTSMSVVLAGVVE